jgi:hypothetical protein
MTRIQNLRKGVFAGIVSPLSLSDGRGKPLFAQLDSMQAQVKLEPVSVCCQVCNRYFTKLQSFELHFTAKHPDLYKGRQWNLNACCFANHASSCAHLRFGDPPPLANVRRVYKPHAICIPITQINCPDCGALFENLYDWSQHYMRLHNLDRLESMLTVDPDGSCNFSFSFPDISSDPVESVINELTAAVETPSSCGERWPIQARGAPPTYPPYRDLKESKSSNTDISVKTPSSLPQSEVKSSPSECTKLACSAGYPRFEENAWYIICPTCGDRCVESAFHWHLRAKHCNDVPQILTICPKCGERFLHKNLFIHLASDCRGPKTPFSAPAILSPTPPRTAEDAARQFITLFDVSN